MRLVEKSFSKDADSKTIIPPWCVEGKRAKRLKETKLDKAKKIFSALKGQVEVAPKVTQELFQTVFKEMGKNPDYVSSFQAPSSLFNQRVSSSRRFAAQSFELDRFRDISKALGVTINDVVLAVCAGALRDYLITQEALPKKPLIAMVPASLRDDDSDMSNRITMILANLGTHKESPLERLDIIKRSVQNAKNRFKRMSSDQILNYSAFVFGAAGVNIASGLMPKRQAFNVIISNVPGPREPLYWNRAKLDALYPVSIVLDGQALNITMTSYLDKLEVGLTGCRKSLPKLQNLLTHLENEIQKFEQIIAEKNALELADKKPNAQAKAKTDTQDVAKESVAARKLV
jgi:diacylglycerol O-acyltransferase